MSEAALPRRRGRPRVEEPRASVSTWMRAKDHDFLVRLADERSISVSAVVRQIVTSAIRKKP